MAHRMTIKITSALNRHKKAINGSNILFLGVAYKPNIADERESPALKIMDEVANKGGIVSFCDPQIPVVKTEQGNEFQRKAYSKELLNSMDCIVISTNHNEYTADFIQENSALVVDLRNLIRESSEKVYKL
jgi:UDP-N-acetyl-D-glucosamine dehydrogenase